MEDGREKSHRERTHESNSTTSTPKSVVLKDINWTNASDVVINLGLKKGVDRGRDRINDESIGSKVVPLTDRCHGSRQTLFLRMLWDSEELMQGTKPENPENVACRLPIDRAHFYYGDKGAIKSDKI